MDMLYKKTLFLPQLRRPGAAANHMAYRKMIIPYWQPSIDLRALSGQYVYRTNIW